jgi:putative transposase
MVAALQQVAAGRSATDVGHEVGVSAATIYAWKAKYGGMNVSEAQEAKQLREENARLKKMLADVMLDKDMLQSVIRKNGARRQKARREALGGKLVSLRIATGRYCVARKADRVSARATALRISPAAHFAATWI